MTDLRYEIRQLIARLECMSHVPAVNLNPEPVTLDESIGGNRPRGGVDRKDDRDRDFMLKSADVYRTRLAGARSERALASIHCDIQQTLKAWTHTPPSSNPEWKSFEWKKQIAREIQTGKRSVDDARRFYKIGRATVYRYLRDYGDQAAA